MKILLASDGSAASVAAARLVGALRWPAGTDLRVVSVVPALDQSLGVGWDKLDQVQLLQKAGAEAAERNAVSVIHNPGLRTHLETRVGEPAREILAAARERHPDLVVLGARGRTGLAGLLLGSTARNVASHAACSVLVARPLRDELRNVVLAVDGSEYSDRAVHLLARLPIPDPCVITLIHVIQPFTPMADQAATEAQVYLDTMREIYEQQRAAGSRLLEAAARQFAGKPLAQEIRTGDPASQILDVAGELHADLIVVGARGVSALEGLFMGSVADRLLRTETASVLLAR